MLTTLTLGRAGSGGRFDLDGASYRIRPRSFRRSYDLVAEDLSPVASAEGARRRRWTVRAPGQIHRFHRNPIVERGESLLGDAGGPAGSIARSGRSTVGADLPGVDTRVQVFAIAVALVRWRRRRRTAAVLGAANG